MAIEYVQVLGSTNTDVTLANSTSLTSLFLQEITGGTLGTRNKVRWQGAGEISFNSNNSLTVYSYYGGLTLSSCVITNAIAANRLNNGLVLEALLASDGSPNSQYGTIESHLGLPPDEDDSIPVGFGMLGAASGGDLDFEIRAQWNAASSNNSITLNGSSLELISYVEDVAIPALDEPTGIIFVDSKLNNLRYDLRKDAYFYAPLEHDLVFYGYKDVTFVRGSASTAVWRDGASHNVAENEPRFEYSGETVLGLAINTGTETLTYHTDNALNSANTLCWIEDSVFKVTPTNSNPFNGSGVYAGSSGVHISNVVKFNRVLTSSEIDEVETALT